MSIFSNTTNQEQQQTQQQNDKTTGVLEKFGTTVSEQASATKQNAESNAATATKEAVDNKVNDGRSWIGEKLDSLKETIEPPKPERWERS